MNKRIVIVGATSAIAEHCARLWVQNQPADLTLIGRDMQRIERVATDLKARSPESEIRIIQTDFLDPQAIHATVQNIVQSGDVDVVLIAHGSLPEQTNCQDDLQACREALEVNGISPALYAEAFAQQMEKVNHGTIALIGSVAGDRGRQSNYVYGAAKGLVTRYAQGLQHRFFGTKVNVLLIKPGPTDTPMTAHLKEKGAKLASASEVAQNIIDAVNSNQKLIYTPSKWRYIMLIIRLLPGMVFNRLKI